MEMVCSGRGNATLGSVAKLRGAPPWPNHTSNPG